MSKAEHLRAHASRLLATAERFRHRGHNGCADQISVQAERYLEVAAALEAAAMDTMRRSPAFIVQAFPPRPPAHAANGGAHPS